MKRRNAATLAGMLLVLLSANLPIAGASGPPADDWWVLGSGGGTAGGGAITLNDTLGQPVTGPANGGAFTSNAGYWQAPAAPAAVPGLRGSRVSGHVQLDWTAVPVDIYGQPLGEVIYRVYRAVDTPYFTPGASPYAEVPAGTTFTDPDTSVIGTVAHRTYYVVTAVSGGLESGPSNRTGVMAYRLVPGS